jgi:hypothetical protein
VKVEFSVPGDEEKATVASADWNGRDVTITCDDDQLRDALARAFRRTAVVTDDAAHRRLGTSGEVVIQPGDLEWFRAVAQVRVPAEAGLHARFVPGDVVGGFDPAGGYRTFEEKLERLDAQTRP